MISSIALALALATSASAAVEWNWSEYGPPVWGYPPLSFTACLGSSQSPINFPTTSMGYTLTTSRTNPVENFVTTKASTFSVSQAHSEPKYTCKVAKSCGSIVWDGVTYFHLQSHFHTGGEHTVDGNRTPMELHMVHQSDAGVLLVFGVLLVGTDNAQTPSPVSNLISQMFSRINDTSGDISLDHAAAVMKGSGYYSYSGSLTTPPCTEGVNWIVQATPVPVTQALIDMHSNKLEWPGNYRPAQALNGRTIKFAVDKPGKVQSISVTCSAGSYKPSDASYCVSCPAGTFSSNAGATSCATCAAGTTSTAGSSACSGSNTCYINECGCPSAFKQFWCNANVAKMQSDWCQASSSNCGICGGSFC